MTFRQLQLLQNAAARVLTETPRSSPQLFTRVSSPIQFKVSLIVSLYGFGPEKFDESELKRWEVVFSQFAAPCWNQLAVDIRPAPTVTSSTEKLKTLWSTFYSFIILYSCFISFCFTLPILIYTSFLCPLHTSIFYISTLCPFIL